MGAPRLRIERLHAGNRDAFARIHCDATGHGWCQCVAWWVPTWEGWGERTAEANAGVRARLFADGISDGYLVYRDDALAGWVQAWKRDAFAKLATQFGLTPDPHAWMVGCFVILPAFRGQGMAAGALGLILDDLKSRGACSVDAFPKRGAQEPGELWNGPEAMFRDAGFKVVTDDPKRPVLRLRFAT